MKRLTIIGVVLIVLGLVALLYQGIPYKSQRDTIQVGPMQATVEEKKTFAVPPVVAVLAVAGGIVLVFMGLRKKS